MFRGKSYCHSSVCLRIHSIQGGKTQIIQLTRLHFVCLQILEDEERCNQLVLDLAKDMACAIEYIDDVEQFARLGQLKQAIKDVQPLMEDTTNFIVEFTSGGKGASAFLCISTAFNCKFALQ